MYGFENLKKFLATKGIIVDKKSNYQLIRAKIGREEFENNKIEFSEHGIYYIDEYGVKHQGYMHQFDYLVERYGTLPRFHILPCRTLLDFKRRGKYNAYYRFSNSPTETVTERSDKTGNTIYENVELQLCGFCRNMGSYRKAGGKALKKIETYIFALKYINASVMSWDPLVRFILPDGLFDYFEMSDFKPGDSEVHIWLEELNIVPVEYQDDKLESKGFYEEIKMHDYPLRGRSCIMHVKRRRWMNHTQEKVVTRNWELVAKGTQISSEFASFLKAMDRLSRH